MDDERARFCADDIELGEIVRPAPDIVLVSPPENEDPVPPPPPPPPPPSPK